MQNLNMGNTTPPPEAGRPAPPHLKNRMIYWGLGGLVLVIVAIFALSARQPGVPMPEQGSPSSAPNAPVSAPAGLSGATPSTPMDPPMTTPTSPGTPPAAGGPAGGTP